MSSDESIGRLIEHIGDRARSAGRRAKRDVHAQLFGEPLGEQTTERISSQSRAGGSRRGSPGNGRVVSGRSRGLRGSPRGPGRLPERIGRFIVLGRLGRGGMGSVVRAFDERLDREVAVKIVHPEVAEEHGQRMLREAKALARLSHPNVVQVYEVGEPPSPFIVMERVYGLDLKKWQRQARPRWGACLEVYIQAGRGLAAAHAKGLIHRDFKPSNCVVDDEGRVRVLDFGLAMDAARRAEPAPSARPDERDDAVASLSSDALVEKITETGALVGTRAYMAPEQLFGVAADAKSDQFSFCVALYEAIYGQLPFCDDSGAAFLHIADGAAKAPRPPPADRRAPRWLRRALWRGLAADPDERWPSMNALLDELERRRRRSRWRSVFVVVGALLLVVVVSLLILFRHTIVIPARNERSLPRGWTLGPQVSR